jgi:hypothetical protein
MNGLRSWRVMTSPMRNFLSKVIDRLHHTQEALLVSLLMPLWRRSFLILSTATGWPRTRDRCYVFKKYCRRKMWRKIWRFSFKLLLDFFQNLIITLVFEKNANFSAENCDHNIDPRVARWCIFEPKIPSLVNFGGPWNGICFFLLEYFITIGTPEQKFL